MASETTIRSYRDVDGYERSSAGGVTTRPAPAADPLAELARIMGQNSEYASLLKGLAGTGASAEPVVAAPEIAAQDAPSEPEEASEPAGDVDWDALEAELESYARDNVEDGAPDAAGQGEAEDVVRADVLEHEDDPGLRGAMATLSTVPAVDPYDDLDRQFAAALAERDEPAPRSESQRDPFEGLTATPARGEARQAPAIDFGIGGTAVAGLAGAAAAGAAVSQWRARSNETGAPTAQRRPVEPASAEPATGSLPVGDTMGQPGAADSEGDTHPPRRRSAGMVAVVAVVGFAVLGGGSVLGYRALTGGASFSGEPPVVRAPAEPVRIPVQQAQDPKPVNDRVPGGERVVSREERPLSSREQAAQTQAAPTPRVIPISNGSAQAPATTTGEEPRRVRTVPIAPDGQFSGAAQRAPAQAASSPFAFPTPAAPAAGPAAQPPPVQIVQVRPVNTNPPPAPQPSATAPVTAPVTVQSIPARPNGPQLAAAPATPAAPAWAAPPAPAAAAPAPVQAAPAPVARPASPPARPAARPADDDEDETPPARPAQRPTPRAQTQAPNAPIDLNPQRTASVRPAQTGGGSFVQISSHQSEAEARAALASAQRRFPQIQGLAGSVQEADLGARGTWYRVRVGPFPRTEAQSVCERLRASGGNCVVN